MPAVVYWLLLLGLVIALFYHGAVLAGWIKDMLLRDFRHYGLERRSYPLPRFIMLTAVVLLMSAPILSNLWMAAAGVLVAVLLFAGAYFVRRSPLRDFLPRWYRWLFAETTRQERREIAAAWFRLPFKTRMRLNGDNHAFRIFVDEVRLTMIYGARDPDDPWAVWQ